jgi:hypothetical protein
MDDPNVVQLLIRAQLPIAEGGLARKSVNEYLFDLDILNRKFDSAFPGLHLYRG